MGRPFRLLIHKRIEAQIRNFVEGLPQSERDPLTKQLQTAFKELKSNPTGNYNVPFHENRNPSLVGKVRKKHIGGGGGYRLMNLVITNKGVVLPFYLSEVKREDFDYADVNWGDIANEIYGDYINGLKNIKEI